MNFINFDGNSLKLEFKKINGKMFLKRKMSNKV